MFSSKVFSILTGLLFTLIAARKLSPSDYGLWGVIAAFASYFLLPIRPLGYWAGRDIARGLPVARSELLLMVMVL